jgi:hypothetical protein
MDGEAIDSWLEATSRAMDLTVGRTLATLGIPPTRQRRLIVRPTTTELNCLAAETGVSYATLLSMTLSRYDGTAIEVDERTGLVAAGSPFARRSGSRFCPDCLAETRGRWKLHWRLGWSFLCTRHGRLLLDACTECQRRPRDSSRPFVRVPSRCICGADLATNRERSIWFSQAVTTAQDAVLGVISNDGASFGVYASGRRPARLVLADLATLANRVLALASLEGFAAVRPADLVRCVGAASPEGRGLSANCAPARALDTAVGVTAAMEILEAPDYRIATQRAAWLWAKTKERVGLGKLAALIEEDNIAAALLAREYLADVGPVSQLRWRTALPLPKVPEYRTERHDLLAASLPAMFWPEWRRRLHVTSKTWNHSLGLTLAAATLLVGSAASVRDAVDSLGSFQRVRAWHEGIEVLHKSDYWAQICTAVTRLSAFLEENPPPIDYTRRRRLDYSSLLSADIWHEICRDDRAAVKGIESGSAARLYLIERITGSPTRTSDLADNFGPLQAGNLLVRDFSHALPAHLAEEIDNEARRFLSRQAIEEPLTWAPPLDMISDLKFPGLTGESMNAHTRR